jgi:predicted ester cyclase/ketosteroid isomerase-like protein
MDTKQIVRGFLEGEWHYEKRVSLCRYLAPEYVMHAPDADIIGCAAYQEVVAADLENIDQMFVTVDDLIAEGDRVVARCTTRFELRGEFLGAYPPGHTIHLQTISIHRVADGRVVESWETYDRRCLLRDLGATQSLGESDRNAIGNAIGEALCIGLRDKRAHARLYYAESAEVISANGEAIRGRNHIAEWLERFPPIADWKLTDIEIDGAGELAFVRGSYTMLLQGRARVPFDHGKYLEVWRKQSDGTWKVIRHAFNSDIAPRKEARTNTHRELTAH